MASSLYLFTSALQSKKLLNSYVNCFFWFSSCKAFFKILSLWQTVRVLFRIVSVFNGLLDPSRFLDFGQDPDPYKTNRDRKHLVAHTHTSCRLGISSLATCYEQKACSPRWSHATNMSNNKLLFYNQSLLNKNMLFSSFVHSIAP